jgi:formyltetrahydrofolate deformylase
MANKSEPSYVLTIDCRDAMGIVAAVATFLTEHGAFITESSHFSDPDTGRFFLRSVFRTGNACFETPLAFSKEFASVSERFGMHFELTASTFRPRVLIAVSKAGHCLNHLLHQWHSDELPIDVVGVVSNHDALRRLVAWHDIPYFHLGIESGGKREQEQRFLEVSHSLDTDLVVLARYMQILSDEMSEAIAGRCINIHHSFLPSFKGAKPYHQAHARGVKVIGATAHYVTADLDEGPIIEQETARVDHGLSADEFVRIGKDIESVVLARAVRWHAERRVLLNGSKTVVFK